MSIQSEIDRINANIAAVYTALEAKGSAMPQTQNSDNLAAAVETIPEGGSVDLSLATAGTGDVIVGKTFYSGDETLKTGEMLGGGTVNLVKYGTQSGGQTITGSINLLAGTYAVRIFGTVHTYSGTQSMRVTLSGAGSLVVNCSFANFGTSYMSDQSPVANLRANGSGTLTVTTDGTVNISVMLGLHSYANYGGGCLIAFYRTA